MPALEGGALDGTTLRMTQHEDQLHAGQQGGELRAADDVRIDEVAGNTRAKDIPDALVKNQLGRDPGVDAADYHRKRVLSRGGGFDLRHQVTLVHPAANKALVAFLQHLQRFVGCCSRLGPLRHSWDSGARKSAGRCKQHTRRGK